MVKKRIKREKSSDRTQWTVTQAKEETWKWFSKFIRYRDAKITTGGLTAVRCCTCNTLITVKEAQAGHFLPGRPDVVLFDEEGVHAQCRRCNIFLSGAWPAYYKYMQKEYSQVLIETMIALWQESNKKYTAPELNALSDYYRMLVEEYESKL